MTACSGMVPRVTCDASLSIEQHPIYVHKSQSIFPPSFFYFISQVWKTVIIASHSFTDLASVQQQGFDWY